MPIDNDALRQEAKRLANLTEPELREELIYQALRLGAISDEAAAQLQEIDREFLEHITGKGGNDELVAVDGEPFRDGTPSPA